MRQERSRPLLESLKQWLEETLVKLSKKSETAQAEQQSSRENSANSLGATVEFVVHNGNKENQERVSPQVSGDEDSNGVHPWAETVS